MKSNVNLSIEIEHEDNLDLNASEIAGHVARYLTSRLDLSEGRAYIVDGRNHHSGPVRVFLQSAAISSRPDPTALFQPLCDCLESRLHPHWASEHPEHAHSTTCPPEWTGPKDPSNERNEWNDYLRSVEKSRQS